MKFGLPLNTSCFCKLYDDNAYSVPTQTNTQSNMDVLDQTTINQTDHVLVNANKKEVIQNIRSWGGPNMDSEHFL